MAPKRNAKHRIDNSNSKNQRNGWLCDKGILTVPKHFAFPSEFLIQQLISFLKRYWNGVFLLTQVIRRLEETFMDYSVGVCIHPIVKLRPFCFESASGPRNLWVYSKTTRHKNHWDTLLVWSNEDIPFQCIEMDVLMAFMQRNTLYISKFYPVCYGVRSCQDLEYLGRELEQYWKNCRQQCNKERQKLPDVRILNDEAENGDRMLLEEHEALKQQLLEKDELINQMKRQLEMMKNQNLMLEGRHLVLEDKLSTLKDKYHKIKKDYGELFLEFGRLSVENDSKINKVKESEQFQKIYIPKSYSCHSDPMPNVLPVRNNPLPASSSSSGQQSVGAELRKSPGNFQQKSDENAQHAVNSRNESDVSAEEIQLSVEVVEGGNTEPISLLSQHSSSIPADVCNAYKLLLLTMSNMLLLTDITKLKEWAKEMFSIQGNLNAYGIFLELDKKGVITALDLSKFCVFFESIVRHDLVHLIDEFMKGDYDKLKKLAYQNKTRNNSDRRVSNSNRVVSSNRVVQPTSNNRGSSERPVRNTRVNVSNAEVDLRNIRVNVSNSQVDLRNSQVNVNNSEVDLRNSQMNVNNSEVDLRNSHVNVNNGCHHQSAGRFPDVSAITNSGGNRSNDRNDASVMTGQVREERTLQHPTSQCNTTHNPTGRCSGTHSHTDAGMHVSSHGNRQDNWLCDHYKRRCLVKFECCDKYWPCHRCHNNLSTCGHRKLKSRDTTMVKCVECGKEQQFGQFCVSCNTQFADFFCGKCKHLTGTDDHPYHCDKCGICRIHGDRSFHCDVCGICLDVQLRGNHKCRPDSAHDECCICLEDAFTGCQILPCSHKVHKECATQMIRSGITRCPICRESFAHKLERRPVKRTTTRRR